MNRLQKVTALLPTVREEGDGSYSVESLSTRGWRYLVSPKTAACSASCGCEDYRRHAPFHPEGYRCIHILAVRFFFKAQRERSIGASVDRLGELTAQLHKTNAAPIASMRVSL